MVRPSIFGAIRRIFICWQIVARRRLFCSTITLETTRSQLSWRRVKEQLELTRPEILVLEQNRPTAPEWLTKEYESTPIYSDAQSYKCMLVTVDE